jgi:hypothetical protein
MKAKYKIHPYAELFPMMTAAELEALTADIRTKGLRQPIVLYEEQILDGRNRLAACETAGVKPTFTTYGGSDADALDLVISLNVQRRDLAAAQRAIVGARCIDHTQHLSRGGRKLLAARFKVGENAIQQARCLLTHAPDLATQVESCMLSLASAYEQCQERRKQAQQKAKDAERVARYAEAISNGEMDYEAVLQKAIEQERDDKERLAAEADARTSWLRGLQTSIEWIENHLVPRTDEDLAWNTRVGAPGWVDHGITVERLSGAIAAMEKLRDFALKDRNHEDTQRHFKVRPRPS